MNSFKEVLQNQDVNHCPKQLILGLSDTMNAVSGKWKLPIIVALSFGEKRFGEISKEVHGITDRMLSKELSDLVLNGLVQRTVKNTFPVVVTYKLTKHSESLDEVIEALRKWGVLHRKNTIKAR